MIWIATLGIGITPANTVHPRKLYAPLAGILALLAVGCGATASVPVPTPSPITPTFLPTTLPTMSALTPTAQSLANPTESDSEPATPNPILAVETDLSGIVRVEILEGTVARGEKRSISTNQVS